MPTTTTPCMTTTAMPTTTTPCLTTTVMPTTTTPCLTTTVIGTCGQVTDGITGGPFTCPSDYAYNPSAATMVLSVIGGSSADVTKCCLAPTTTPCMTTTVMPTTTTPCLTTTVMPTTTTPCLTTTVMPTT